jgi:tRNA-specific 2-thiouridylase
MDNMKTKSVLVGISGGVDSAVAAAILKEEGYHVEGLYLYNGFPTRAEEDAVNVAKRLSIPLHRIDISESFKKNIADYFVSEYLAARTPNPCIVCNKKIKFKYLLEQANKRRIGHIATGHYARIEDTGSKSGFRLKRGIDKQKDQSYFLFESGQRELEKIIFPNGDKTKEKIKNIARDLGLGSLSERESQEICFIPDNNYRSFIENYTEDTIFHAGNIVDGKGNIVGRHCGIHSVTIGQRKGLNIASERPYYVLEIARDKNEVIVGREEDQFFDGLIAGNVSWSSTDYPSQHILRATTHIRYRHKGVASEIKILPSNRQSENCVSIRFDKPQKAVAPGQAVVFYQNDYLIGGGWIEKGVHVD